MNNRLEYVDAIKGFAVLLMVMGMFWHGCSPTIAF